MTAAAAVNISTNEIGDLIAALYIEQYGHWELPHTSQILSKYVGSESNIVSLKRSRNVKKILYY